MTTRPPVVVVVGSVNSDMIVTVPRLPSPGETVIGGRFLRAGGGKSANQAVAAARVGARVLFVARVGDDSEGQAARSELISEGVDVSGLMSCPEATGVALILVDERGDNLIAVASGANATLDAAAVEQALSPIRAAHAVLLCCLEVPDTAVTAAARIAEERGWPFVLDPAPARPLPPALLKRCTVLTPNAAEAQAIGAVDDLLDAGAGAVVVTLGADGAEIHRLGHRLVRQPAFPVAAIDTTGAGDTFSAVLAVELARNRPLEDAVRQAAAAAALATRDVGARTSMPDSAELERYLSDQPHH